MRHNGFTLIEVMLALLLTSAVVGVTGVVAVQSVRVQRSARGGVSSAWQKVQIVRQIEADVSSAIRWLPDSVTPVTAGAAPGELLRVYCLADVSESTAAARFRLPSLIRYLVEDLPDGSGGRRLVRKSRNLTASAPAVKQSLSSDLADAYVEVRTKGSWSRPAGQSRRAQTVEALRLVMSFTSSPDEVITKTFILPERQLGRQVP